MIYKQTAILPIIFQVDEGIIFEIDTYLKRNNLFFTNILIVSGQNVSSQYADKMSRHLDCQVYRIKNNNEITVNTLSDTIRKEIFQLVIGVGGGKVLDTVKRACYLTSTNSIAVPTILSNDGLISPVAVIADKNGQSVSLPGMSPLGVIIDLEVIKSSPIKYLRAAAGDIFSNLSATNDWVIANKFDERINDLSFHLSRGASNSLLGLKSLDFNDKLVLRLLVSGLINSGLAMSLSGNSRPCSGSEHLISHALDALVKNKTSLHGEQVASASLFTLYLQKKLSAKHIALIKDLEIPVDFRQFVPKSQNIHVRDIFNKARKMRPGRITILDKYNDVELAAEYKKYISLLPLSYYE